MNTIQKYDCSKCQGVGLKDRVKDTAESAQNVTNKVENANQDKG